MKEQPMLLNTKTVILADGDFPVHAIPLLALKEAKRIVCCDGAVVNLLKYGMEPTFIVGDMDSLPVDLKEKYVSVIFPDFDQNSNDLTKAIRFCMKNDWYDITILGATGKREDHTLANLSLLADYGMIFHVQLLTDYGVFTPQYSPLTYESHRGQQVSIFSLREGTTVTTRNLLYPMSDRSLASWWEGSLNESAGDTFEIVTHGGKLLVFREYGAVDSEQ